MHDGKAKRQMRSRGLGTLVVRVHCIDARKRCAHPAYEATPVSIAR
jgi:hypothetical protein